MSAGEMLVVSVVGVVVSMLFTFYAIPGNDSELCYRRERMIQVGVVVMYVFSAAVGTLLLIIAGERLVVLFGWVASCLS